MSAPPRFVMLGGFLGAGKTTTLARLARRYQARGQHVVIVTNDQAADLVDTLLLRAQGFDVGEVAGSCFCCNFNALTGTVEQLSADRRPDVVLAEPVGSCTDLAATVLRPLQEIYGRPFDIAPYGVIVKPSHGTKILRGGGRGGFSPQAEYIFRKQIEEADFVIVNRVDELPAEQIDELARLLEEQYPGRPVVRMSALTGEGFGDLCARLEGGASAGRRGMDVDYDVYAAGEAELGWLNGQAAVAAPHPLDLDAFLLGLLGRLRDEFAARDAETAHLKAIGLWEGFYGVANVISNASQPVLSLPSGCRSPRFELVVNARVATDPEGLEALVREAVAAEAARHGAAATLGAVQSFRPGRPVPTHRIVA